ncbi:signal recognition particle-docking protein FtsY [Ammonifex degensii KC4]|uniref:Signal recognition particle receptor FtsY n=1 Tax=Ammonifex degensii (strain DSM 10501 / KC4) TaxID=429009 RepID=C9RCX0_AMMDK|nr:signal recognition particle-docking protein FtsY [Ammonifex degensii]ACX52097.1 signal recognition particle-docking protein FtsY [Ammonifex degensii KC4]
MGLFDRLKASLGKVRETFTAKIDNVLRRRKIDEELYEELEDTLILADVGVPATEELLEKLKARVKAERVEEVEDLRRLLQEEILHLLGEPVPLLLPPSPPAVILLVGVNGTGKTTTAGKLAYFFRQQGKKVLLAAADTFRAAAIDQLEIWAEKSGSLFVRQKEGSDPAAVVFDALQAAKARGVDVVIADTAGRLHTKSHLMAELGKIVRVAAREVEGAPHEVLLVLDATTGQNALSQARLFKEVTGVTGIVLTKLDGTAKGGVVIAIRKELGLPVKFIGTGEKIEDLAPFDPAEFVKAIFD